MVLKAIREISSRYRFIDVGITDLSLLKEGIIRYRKWLNSTYIPPELSYLKDLNRRFSIDSKFKTVFVFVDNYYSSYRDERKDTILNLLSIYARGYDYHYVIKQRLKKVVEELISYIGPFNYSIQVDSGPINERSMAVASGLGWIGKNGCFYHKKNGSFVFLGLIVTELEVSPQGSSVVPSQCKNCDLCVKNCPNNAIKGDGTIELERCVSYLTIEKKGELSPDLIKNIPYIFGCDLCQLSCPYNKDIPETEIKEYYPLSIWKEMTIEKLKDISNTSWKKLTSHSPLRRTRLEKIKQILSVTFNS